MRIGGIITVIAMTGCRGGDSLAGDWSGDLTCNDIEYEVEARFFEDSRQEYSGQMLFEFSQDVRVGGRNGVFTAQLRYDFTTTQPYSEGGQDIFLDMTWTKVYCEVDYDGDVEEGGCVNIGGMNLDEIDERVGYVEMRYSGTDRLTVDDDNCNGVLKQAGYIPE